MPPTRRSTTSTRSGTLVNASSPSTSEQVGAKPKKQRAGRKGSIAITAEEGTSAEEGVLRAAVGKLDRQTPYEELAVLLKRLDEMAEILHPGFFRFFPGIITYDDSKQRKRAVRRGDGKQAATILEWAGMRRDRHECMSIGVCCSWTTTWVGKDLKDGDDAKNRAWVIVTVHPPGHTRGKQIAIWDCNTPEWDPTDAPVRERDVLSSRAPAILKTLRDKASGRSRDRVWHSFTPERAVDEGESIKATFQYLLDLVLRGPSILKMSGTDGVEGVEGFGEIRH